MEEERGDRYEKDLSKSFCDRCDASDCFEPWFIGYFHRFLFVEDPPEQGYSASFAFWIYAVYVSIFSLKYYTIDAIISVVNVFRKVDPIFNSVLAVVLFAGIPLGIFIGGGRGLVVNIIIWFSYCLVMFILELVSVIRLIKYRPIRP